MSADFHSEEASETLEKKYQATKKKFSLKVGKKPKQMEKVSSEERKEILPVEKTTSTERKAKETIHPAKSFSKTKDGQRPVISNIKENKIMVKKEANLGTQYEKAKNSTALVDNIPNSSDDSNHITESIEALPRSSSESDFSKKEADQKRRTLGVKRKADNCLLNSAPKESKSTMATQEKKVVSSIFFKSTAKQTEIKKSSVHLSKGKMKDVTNCTLKQDATKSMPNYANNTLKKQGRHDIIITRKDCLTVKDRFRGQ
jgi:hypothetical protein